MSYIQDYIYESRRDDTMSKVYLLHGFNVHDQGNASVDTLIPSLEAMSGYKVIDLDYGFFFRLRVRLCNRSVAKILASIVEPDDVVIGHSNGCAIIYEAVTYGAKFAKAVLITPALDSDIAISVDQVKVFYSPTDKATWLAKYIPLSIWGNQGRKGYTGPYRKGYSQVNMDMKYGQSLGHSGVFSDITARSRLLEDIKSFIED